jgi:hypothetical protein
MKKVSRFNRSSGDYYPWDKREVEDSDKFPKTWSIYPEKDQDGIVCDHVEMPLREAREFWEMKYEIDRYRDVYRRQIQIIKRLRKALEVYGDEKNWSIEHKCSCTRFVYPTFNEWEVAQEALKEDE